MSNRLLFTLAIAALVLTGAVTASPVELVYVPYYSGERGIVEQQIVEMFNASHPHIHVNIVDFPGKSVDTVLTRLAAGEQIDVASFHQNLASLMWMGHTLELTQLVARDRFPLQEFRPGSLQHVTYNGRILGFPFGVGGEYLYVNQTLFQQAGVAEPRKGWTVREFESALPKLTKVDGDGKVTQWAVGYNGSYLSGPAPFYFLDGGSYLTAQGQLNLNQEQVYSRMDWLAEITAKGWARSGWSGPWEAGQMAMAVDWEGRVLQHIKAKTHERYDWRLDYMPVGNAGPFTVLSIHQTVILRQTKHPEEAWTFMKYLYREGEILFGQNMLYPATVTGARAILNKGHETLPPGYDIRRFYAPVLDPPDTGIVYPMNVPGWLEAEGLLNGAWQAVLRGEKPARVAIEEVADQVNNLLADFREKAAIK